MPPWVSMYVDKSNGSVRKRESVDSAIHNDRVVKNKYRWRPSLTMMHRLNLSRRSSGAVLESMSTVQNDDTISHSELSTLGDDNKSTKSSSPSFKRQKSTRSLVSVVLVEAKDLPGVVDDGSNHSLYCKLRLGTQTHKSKGVEANNPQWRERFHFTSIYKDEFLKITLWDKGKQKHFMGNCTIDLAKIEKERTVKLWQPLDDGYGLIHLSITVCNISKTEESNDLSEEKNEDLSKQKESILSLAGNWNVVGELQVTVISVKGLSGKLYATLGVDNEIVRTHTTSGSDPVFGQSFVFNVYDVTTTLELKVYEKPTITNTLRNESVGRVIIPLLRIPNKQKKWYVLKDKSKRNIAKSSCPRVLLEMQMYWNPVKAAAKVFRPKEVQYIPKRQTFDVGLVYKNIEFVRDVFVMLVEINEKFKRLFEWDNMEYSVMALVGWLVFWFFFRPWATPLLLLLPFCYFWFNRRHEQQEFSFLRGYGVIEATNSDTDLRQRSFTNRIHEVRDMTLTITDGIQYLASLAEKLYNLASFKVPFLSYLTISLLLSSAIAFYTIQMNYLMMLFGIYKFTRKYLNPSRVLNNDLVDFLSRIPDTDMLNDWKELNVPEPAPRSSARTSFLIGGYGIRDNSG